MAKKKNTIKFALNIEGNKKQIIIQEDVKFSDLIDSLDKLLPNDTWRDFEILKAEKNIEYLPSPTIIREYPWYPRPYYDRLWWSTGGTYNAHSSDNTTNDNNIKISASVDHGGKSGVPFLNDNNFQFNADNSVELIAGSNIEFNDGYYGVELNY